MSFKKWCFGVPVFIITFFIFSQPVIENYIVVMDVYKRS